MTQRNQINHLNLVWNSGVQTPLKKRGISEKPYELSRETIN